MEKTRDEINGKFKFIFLLIVWIIALIIVLAITLPALIISIQYTNVDCVAKSNWFDKLADLWLLASSVMILGFCFLCLGFICLGVSFKFWKRLFVFFALFCTIIIGIGWGIFLNTTLNCEYDSLWMMILVFLIILTTTITIYICTSIIIKCRKKRQLRNRQYTILNTHF